MNRITCLSVIACGLLLAGCSSVDGDAKKAARYEVESVDYMRKAKLDDAKEKFDRSQAIIERYKTSDKHDLFFNAYHVYLKQMETGDSKKK